MLGRACDEVFQVCLVSWNGRGGGGHCRVGRLRSSVRGWDQSVRHNEACGLLKFTQDAGMCQRRHLPHDPTDWALRNEQSASRVTCATMQLLPVECRPRWLGANVPPAFAYRRSVALVQQRNLTLRGL